MSPFAKVSEYFSNCQKGQSNWTLGYLVLVSDTALFLAHPLRSTRFHMFSHSPGSSLAPRVPKHAVTAVFEVETARTASRKFVTFGDIIVVANCARLISCDCYVFFSMLIHSVLDRFCESGRGRRTRAAVRAACRITTIT